MPRGFSSPELSFFDRKTSEALGMHHLQVTATMDFKCLRQRSNGLKICLPAVFYMYVFFWFHSQQQDIILPYQYLPSLRNNGIVFEDSDVNWELDGVKFNITGDKELTINRLI
jgi:hypothetical protein